jgi:hypothetical protein
MRTRGILSHVFSVIYHVNLASGSWLNTLHHEAPAVCTVAHNAVSEAQSRKPFSRTNTPAAGSERHHSPQRFLVAVALCAARLSPLSHPDGSAARLVAPPRSAASAAMRTRKPRKRIDVPDLIGARNSTGPHECARVVARGAASPYPAPTAASQLRHCRPQRGPAAWALTLPSLPYPMKPSRLFPLRPPPSPLPPPPCTPAARLEADVNQRRAQLEAEALRNTTHKVGCPGARSPAMVLFLLLALLQSSCLPETQTGTWKGCTQTHAG